jgi:hypothetical protein
MAEGRGRSHAHARDGGKHRVATHGGHREAARHATQPAVDHVEQITGRAAVRDQHAHHGEAGDDDEVVFLDARERRLLQQVDHRVQTAEREVQAQRGGGREGKHDGHAHHHEHEQRNQAAPHFE